MEASDLIKLGFNRNEAVVYLSLVKFGKADAGRLIKDTKFHKNIVYDNLDKLINKGLVSYVAEEGRKVFQISSSDMIVKMIEEEEKELKDKKEFARKISEEIDEQKIMIIKKHEASVFRGVNAIKSFYNETLKGGDYVVFGAPENSLAMMGETFWRNYNTKREHNKIKVRMIFNPSLKSYGNSIKNKWTSIRYFERDFEPLTETHIQEDKVGIVVWSDEPILFLIEDEAVAKSYLKFFEKMWIGANK
jgi:sugar-specific transcriptional regulator TrmB